jgi:hypothetical protein
MISHERLPMDWESYWHWLAPLTTWLGRYALLAALVGSAAGLVLWLAGSRFSRSLVTLLAVSVGAVVGMHLPGWFHWPVDGMGLAVGGAIVLGLSGFLLHNTWVGISLSGLLALWAGRTAWAVAGGGAKFEIHWPEVDPSADAATVLASLWHAMPGELPWVMPLAVAGALVVGVTITVVSPKLARVLAYSLAGLSLLVVAGLWAMRMSQPQWLAMLPRDSATRGILLLTLLGIGVLIQWRLTPAGRPAEK